MAIKLKAFRELAKKIQKLDENKILKKVFSDDLLQAQILDLNTKGQLYERGVDSKGDPTGEYAPFTLAYKQTIAGALGNDTRTDHITLKDTGEFYESFKFKNKDDGFIIEADTQKEETDLQQVYPHVLGLDAQSRNEIRNDIKIRFMEILRNSFAR